jgi:hypothetical protein
MLSAPLYTWPMSKSPSLEEMNLHEKLAMMEALWEDLSGSTEPIESPAWHKEILDERRKRVASGEAKFTDWETAKAEMRKKIE